MNSQLSSLRDVASQINSGEDLKTILKNLIVAACRHANWTLGSIMTIDEAHGFAYVMVRHDPALLQRELPDRWELATSPSLIALQRNEPVYIRDVRESEEFPGYRQEGYERDYRTLLVMPMDCADAGGRPMVLSVVSRNVTEVGEDDLAFLGMIVHLGVIAVRREHRLQAEKTSARRLDNALKAHTSLLEHVLADGSVFSLAMMIGQMLHNPIVVVDFTTNSVIAGKSPSSSHASDQQWQEAASSSLRKLLIKATREALKRGGDDSIPILIELGAHRFNLSARIEGLVVDTECVGALIIFQTVDDPHEIDQLMLDSARSALSVQMMRSFIRFRFETRNQTELFFEVAERRWRDRNDVLQRAQRLGIKLGSPLQMMLIDFPERTKAFGGITVDIEHSVSRILKQAAVSGNIVAIEGGLVCLIEPENAKHQDKSDRLAQRIAEELGRFFGEQPLVVAGEVCATLDDYPGAWERCSRLVSIGRSFKRTGALVGRDFGPLPMLVAASDAAEVRAFIFETIGAIAAHDRENDTPYLETLAAYLRDGCRSQACADAMGLHVTTLRYRLSRIQELFGVNVETSEKRFAVELALMLHRVVNKV